MAQAPQNLDLAIRQLGLKPIQMGGPALARMTADGKNIEAVFANVALSEKMGEFCDIQGRAMTTANGYKKLNQIAGVSVITPQRLSVPIDGKEVNVPNPYPIIDPKSGSISKVWVRKVAIGFSPIGNLVATSASLLYDIRMYFVQECFNKIMYNAEAGEVCNWEDVQQKTGGRFEPIEGDMGIWINYKHKEIMKAIGNFTNKKQFAERNAQTICERLVMSKQPALAYPFVDEFISGGAPKQRYATLPVWGYKSNLTQEQLLLIAEQVENGEEIKIPGIEVEYREVEASQEELDAMATAEQDSDEFSTLPSYSEDQNSTSPQRRETKFRDDKELEF
ncbi:hypothetical protein CIG75_12925 [Tumebacillus algifaecis]|uniref:Uncharacterized protein n=2 Tax=Tumebacillus algifaecis TaxID=1214604 RepID=A0A223D2G8_9BACL|nr:hypothetical protein CIG75_12925 [Tumebacillus algifaecis]